MMNPEGGFAIAVRAVRVCFASFFARMHAVQCTGSGPVVLGVASAQGVG